MDRIFIDTDVVLDLLGQRLPFYEFSARLFSEADRGHIELLVSSLSFSNLNYLLSKQYSPDQARKKLLKFKALVTVLSVNDKIVDLALSSDFKDFEDGLQYFTAIENGVGTIITRNLKDFKPAQIVVMTAEQYLNGK